jgi:autotransporter adhesin
MNTIYRLVWSAAQQAWVVASEFASAKGKGKDGSSTRRARRALMRAGGMAGMFAAALVSIEPAEAWTVTTGSLSNGGTAAIDGNMSNNTAIGSGAVATGATNSTGMATAVGNNASAVGDKATALGNGASAGGVESTALGTQTNASGLYSLAIGSGNQATAQAATAIGYKANATTAGAIALGYDVVSSGSSSIGIGQSVISSGKYSLAIGYSAQALTEGTTALGDSSYAKNVGDTAVGYGAYSAGGTSVAMGNQASASGASSTAVGGTTTKASGNTSTALGSAASATGSYSTSLGGYSTAGGNSSVGIGYNAYIGSTSDFAVAVGGSATATKNATALGYGAKANNSSDVALGNGSITAATVATPSMVIAGKTYNNLAGVAPKSTVSVGTGVAGGERTITNVAAGRVDATSTDAINGSQLAATNQAINDSKAHYYSVNDNGVQDTNYNNEGATGINALAAGVGTAASGNYATALGTKNQATGLYSTAVGSSNTAAGQGSVVVGRGSNTGGDQSVAIGYTAAAATANSVAIGTAANTKADFGVAVGYQAITDAAAGTAVGDGAHAEGSGGASAYGYGAYAGGTSSTAIGVYTKATKTYDTALGYSANASGGNSTALGTSSIASAVNAVALGNKSTASGTGSIAAGQYSIAAGNYGLALGQGAQANALDGVALGYDVQNQAIDAIGIGSSVRVASTATNSIALGKNASIIGANSVALGAGSVSDSSTLATSAYNPNSLFTLAGTTPTGEVSIGATGKERRITNLAAGAQDTDAVNVSQLKSVASGLTHYYSVNDFGVAGSNYNNDGAVGMNSLAAGVAASSVGQASMAMGYQATSTGESSIATGMRAHTSGINSIALGVDSATTDATSTGAVAIGWESLAGATDATAIGSGAQAQKEASIAIGAYAGAEGVSSIAQGNRAIASGDNAISIGERTKAAGADSLALGSNSIAGEDGSVALGANSITAAAVATPDAMIGGKTYDFAGIAPTSTVSVGDKDAERTITNVAAGRLNKDSTDAINGSQLFATNQAIDGLSDSSVKYDNNADGTVNYNSVTMGGDTYDNSTHTGGTTITNVADGVAPSDAVNYSQLTETNNNVTNLGDDVKNIYNTGTKYFHANSTGTDSSALGQDSVAIGMGAISTHDNDVALGAGSVTASAEGTANATINGKQYDFAGATPTSTVSVGDKDAERTITNVAAGRLNDKSTDAVNGSQLFATNQSIDTLGTQVETNTTNIATNTTNIATNTTNIAGNTTNINELKDDALQWDPAANGGAGAYSADHKGKGPAKITNVAAGDLTDTSTDAVNGSQLKETNDQVATNTTNIAGNTTDIANLGDTVTNIYNTGTKYFHANSTGTDSVASGIDAVAIGMGAIASADGSIALGAGSLADGSTLAHEAYLVGGTAKGEMNVGDRRITGLAAGADDMDAVNVAQLKATAASSVADAVMYDNSTHNNITLGGNTYDNSTHTGGTTITNVADGVAPSDAVNYSQLTETNNNVTNLGDDVKNIYNTGTKYFHANSTGTDSSALGQDAVAIGMGAISTHDNDVALGAGSVTASAEGTANVTINGKQYDFAGATPTSTVSVGDKDAERTITNVAAGRLNETSTDAVNGSQLFATNQSIDTLGTQVETNTTNIATNTTNIATNTTNIATNTTNIAGNTTNINELKDDALQWDPAANGGAGAYSADHKGKGPAKITNVAAGDLTDTSTDAVNGSQLKETNDQVATNTTNIAGNTTDIANLGDTVTNIYNTGTKYFHANSTGTDSSALGQDSVAIGMGAISTHDNDVALGAGSVTASAEGAANVTINGKQYDFAGATPTSTVSVGDKDAERTITNVAAGRLSESSTDAVNGSQLFAANQSIDTLGTQVETNTTNITTNTTNIATNTTNIAGNTTNINELKDDALQWDPAANGGAGAYSADHKGKGPAKITNVAAGDLTDTSTDAVNGSQLKETNDQVAINTTNIAGNTTDIANLGDTVTNIYNTGTKYFHANSTGTDSVASGIDAVAIGMGAIASADGSIALGAGSLADGSTLAHEAYLVGGTAKGEVNVGDRRITGLSAGADDMDAVNVAQLKATAAGSVADAVMYDNSTHNNITLGGNTYDNSTHTGGTTITNVADGVAPSDAVNYSQLTETNNNVTNLGDNVNNIYNKGTKYFHANSTGTDSVASGLDAVAIGMGAIASADGSVALGAGSLANGSTLSHEAYLVGGKAKGEVNVGDRRITGLAAGADDMDAVNVAQLKATAAGSVADAVMYDNSTHNNITLDGNTYDNSTHTGGTTITNVADGVAPSDAVNYSQLTETNNQVSTNTTNIANNTTNINGLKDDALQWDASLNAYSANHMGKGPAKITNVAAGDLTDTSTDAVNGSQLKATNDQVDINTTNIAGNTTSITNLGDTVDNIYNTGTKYFHANSTGTDSVASGLDAVAIGMGAIASADNSIALGAGSLADGSTLSHQAYLVGGTARGEVNVGNRRITGVAAGADATDAVNVEQLTSVMNHYYSFNDTSVPDANFNNDGATGANSIAAGINAAAKGEGAVATGVTAKANGDHSISLGYGTIVNGARSAAIGDPTIVNGDDSYSLGNENRIDSNKVFVIGNNVTVGTGLDGAVVLGDGSTVNAAEATSGVTLNGKDYAFAGTTPTSTVSVGAVGAERTITNVAAGRLNDKSTDAVNGSQLFATNQAIDGLQTGSVQYDTHTDGTTNYNSVTLGGDTYDNSTHTGGTTITNVADGVAPSDAVNYSQLTETNNNVTNLGDNVNNIYNKGTKYFHANSTGIDSVASGLDAVAIGMGAVASANGSVALGAGSLANGSTLSHQAYLVGGTAKGEVNVGDRRITGLSAGADDMDAVNVAQLKEVTSGAVADAVIYDNSGHNTISLSGSTYNTYTHTGGTVITNVGNGEISSTSSDAVNGSQLNDTNEQVATNTTNIANNTTNINGLKDDALQWDASVNAYSANHMGKGPAKITNVAAGDLTDTSTDAVNGSQLKATNDQVDINTTNIAGNTTAITNLGDTVDNIYNTGTKYFHANSTGTDSVASGIDAVAIGMGAIASADGSIALGAGSLADGSTLAHEAYLVGGTAKGEVNVGDRRITGLAAGADDMDAVNVAQLKQVATDSVADVVKYDNSTHNNITLGGNTYDNSTHTGGTTITNVADGVAPSDAVNYSQLTETNNNVTNLGDNVNNIYNKGTKYFHANSTGTDSVASGLDAVAIGMGAVASADGSVALGAGSLANGSTLSHQAYLVGGTAKGEVNVGDRRITGLSAGADDADAVNVAQLKQVTSGAVADAVMYDNSTHNSITLGGTTYDNSTHTGGTTITNVADGKAPSDAVNYSQLTETNNQVAINTTNITNNTNDINGLKDDALQWDAKANGGKGAYSANHMGKGPAKITNVAAGDISATSTDAVNGSQLFGLQTEITNITNNGVKYFHTNSTAADSKALSAESIAVGGNAQASGASSIAMGSNAKTTTDNSVAIGGSSSVSGKAGTAIGDGAIVTADNAVALGAGSVADRMNSVSVGSKGNERQITNVKAGTEDTDAVNLAQLKEVSGNVINMGNTVNQNTTDITKIQNGTDGMFQVKNTDNLPKPSVTGDNSVAGGAGSKASGNSSMAVGTSATASGANSVALGNSSSATADNSVALGSGSVADRTNSVSVGSAGNERQITNVAAGTKGTDGVNVNQLTSGINESKDYTNSKFNDLKNQVDKQNDKLEGGIAGAMAMASMPQPYSAGASMFSMGGASYGSQGAVAMGVSTISDNGKWVTKLQGTTTTQGDVGVAVGVGYQW